MEQKHNRTGYRTYPSVGPSAKRPHGRDTVGVFKPQRIRGHFFLMLAILTVGFWLMGRVAAGAEETVPQRATGVLSSVCLKCHNSSTKAGGIDLSSRATALKAGVFGTGDALQSRLVKAVSAGKMPPTGKLPEEQIALLRRWVMEGAVYPQATLTPAAPVIKPLWSLLPVKHSAIPKTPYDALAKTAIDSFVFERLAKQGLKPSEPASRLALLRRVTLDLTGLPPTPDEIDAFLADRSPDAYERVVDRLLASPAYGERWARDWLDVVRYGESQGYEQNHLRPNAWPYRDYVIRAFNADKPYTQFIAEQIAGDVVGKGDPDVEAATGFLVAGIHDTVGIQTEEGTRQQRANDLDDIVSTTAAAFLGLTVNCAHCHDHKFDPIPQRDYFRLSAVFAGVRHGERTLPARALTPQEKQEAQDTEQRILSVQNRLNELDSQAREAVFRSRGVSPPRPAVSARRNVDDFSPVSARFVRFTVLATSDGAQPCIDELQIYGPESDRNIALASTGAKATASDLIPGYAIHQVDHLNDGKFGNEWSWISNTPNGGWAQIELPHSARINRVVWSRDGAEISRFDDRLPTKYRIEVSDDGKAWRTVSTDTGRAGSNDYLHPDELRKAMTPAQRKERDDRQAELQQLKQRAATLNSVSMAYIGQFNTPDPIFLLNRGDVMQRGEQVLPGAFSAITALNSDLITDWNAPEPERRLALARWIGNEKNPLTARVLVNRIWQYHFGRGLVTTPSDFGNNGEKPTHPELLDYLAGDFMANGWKIKRLHKLLVMSYTYRQTSDANDRGMAVDAGNQLLWHMPLRRMEAEAIRDSILATSGKLNRQMYGPSYRLFKYTVVNVAIYDTLEDYSPETWRRGIYQQTARSIHDELLSTFDCPELSQRAARRESTTTALQALSLLNGPFMVQQSHFFAERIRSEAGSEATAQVELAFRLAFGRPPNSAERAAALKLLADRDLPTLCRGLLNTNEFLYY